LNDWEENWIEGAVTGGGDEAERTALPAYLETPPETDRPYGTITYNSRRKTWSVRADRVVTQLIKRLFPGSDTGVRGRVSFPDHWRFVGEMNWLLLRFPMEIAPRDRVRWNNTLSTARRRALDRETYRANPLAVRPDPLTFCGQLIPFQETGVGFLLTHDRSLLADEMGLGKTVQAIAWLAIRGEWPVLVVVPPHLVTHWKGELNRFLRVRKGEESAPPEIHVLKGLTPYALPPADVYIVHYLLLRGWKKALPALGFKTVLFDEIQELRRAGTEKYSAASLTADAADAVVGLSGTPIYNLGGEIFHVMNILDYHCLGDYESFTREWCTGYGRNLLTKPELLGEYLRREGMMLRRTKREVLQELPPKRRVVQEIDADAAVYRREMAGVGEMIRQLSVLGSQGWEASRQALLKEQIVSAERQATGLAKAPFTAAFVAGLADACEKILLFAHHHSVFDAYRKLLREYRPVFITGRENTAQKDAAVTAFMEGKTSICCISLRAAAGLNLQAATCVVFGELDWSPAVHSQAEDRAHRIGQQDSLLCYYLVSSQGADAEMQEALGLKVSQFLGLMGEKPAGPEVQDTALREARKHMDEIIARLSAGKTRY
jgi:SWI/SNF-related matrix-associated actin-dependent regulator 1 of chromatin subfamily A